jgi:hypothetical protein
VKQAPYRQSEPDPLPDRHWKVPWELRLLEKVLLSTWRDALVGDLFEEWTTDIVPNHGRARAHWWLAWQVGLAIAASLPTHFRRASLKTKLLLPSAFLLGGFSAFVDSCPTWDDTGVLACGIAVACAFLGALEPKRPWLWGLAVGLWIPLYEINANGSYAASLALLFAFAGAYSGAGVCRLLIHALPAEVNNHP